MSLQEPAYRETEQSLVGREFVGIIPLSEQRTANSEQRTANSEQRTIA
jgi:hypothetical protein